MRWGVVILGGGTVDPAMAQAIGATNKSLALLNNKISVQWVLEAVAECRMAHVVTVGPESLRDSITQGEFRVEGGGAVENVKIGIDALPEADAILMLPSDSPFLTSTGILHFLGHIERDLSDQGGKWCATSLCPIEAFRSFFPNCPASGVPLQKTEYVSGALYACGVQGFETVRPTMVQLRTARKAPLEMARIVLSKVGILMLIQAIWRRKQPTFLEQVLTRAVGVETKIYLDADAPSCMDFDTPEEWEACVRHAATISESK